MATSDSSVGKYAASGILPDDWSTAGLFGESAGDDSDAPEPDGEVVPAVAFGFEADVVLKSDFLKSDEGPTDAVS